jgi:hypothetical protein
MKKALLTGIAALFLATGAYHQGRTDVWSRRSECIQIGKNKLEKALLHYKGQYEAKYDWQVAVRTNYDAETSHCYVLLEGSANSGVFFRQLFDGQTDELLADNSGLQKDGRFERWGGSVTDPYHVFSESRRKAKTAEEYRNESYDDAVNYINQLMREKR